MQNDPYKDRETPHRDEDLLRELYCVQGLNVNQIADEIGSAPSTIWRWVNKYNLERPERPCPWRDKDTLEWMFYERGMSRQEIADYFGVWRRTVNRWLREHDLQPETPSLRYGRLDTSTHGYVHFIDYRGPNEGERVLIHRLLACVDHSLDELKDNHVHHKIPIPWLNYQENIEVLSPKEHHAGHNTGEFDRENVY